MGFFYPFHTKDYCAKIKQKLLLIYAIHFNNFTKTKQTESGQPKLKKPSDEMNMFANQTQILMKIANMEFHPTLNNKLITDETN